MNYFETAGGQSVMESIANSLERIAKALEENNQLMARAIQSGNDGKRIAQCNSASNAVKNALDELIP